MLAGEPFPAALKERFSCVARIAGRRAWYSQCNCDARVHRASFFEAGSQGPPCDPNLPPQNPECSPQGTREASAARLSSSGLLVQWADGRTRRPSAGDLLISVAFPSSYMALIEQAASRRAG